MLFVLILLTCGLLVTGYNRHSVDLNDENFGSSIRKYDTALVLFHASWCNKCRKLRPQFERAAKVLSDRDPPVGLIRVDCTDDGEETCAKFSVKTYPTLKIFKKGEFAQEFRGPHDMNGIIKFMDIFVKPSPTILTTKKDLEAFMDQSDPVIVYYVKSESSIKEPFLELANKLREIARFGLVESEDVLTHPWAEDGVVLYRPAYLHNKFEPPSVKYEGEANTKDLKSWIRKNLHGIVGYRTEENMDDFQFPIIIAYYDVDFKKNPKGTNYWRNRILKASEKFRDDFSFAICSRKEFSNEIGDIDETTKPKPLPPIIMARYDERRKYVMSESFSVENLEAFFLKLKMGILEPYIRSLPLPQEPQGLIKTAVAKNFKEVVIENGFDTFILFFSPWCAPCKRFAPVFDDLADELRDEEVAFVKMDAVSNDIPEPYKIKAYPTLMWAPLGEKDSPIEYDGDRTLKELVKFIAKHSTHGLRRLDRTGRLRKRSLEPEKKPKVKKSKKDKKDEGDEKSEEEKKPKDEL